MFSTANALCYAVFVSVHANTFYLGNYIHASTNEAHSLANLQDLIPTLEDITMGNTN